MKNIGYKVYSRNGVITIYRDGEDKVRIEKAFGEEYSKDRLSERLSLSRQIVFKPMSQKSIFDEYSKTNKPHKGIAEINDIKPKIKELYKYDKYCKDITKRAKKIQSNLNNFDKDIQKEKDNSRSM